MKNFSNCILDSMKTVFFAIVVAVIFRSFLYEPFYIPSGSMKSTLLEGDIVAVSKFKYGFSKHSLPFSMPLIKNRIMTFGMPRRGDIIVFRLPKNPHIHYIKRLVGLPGDSVQLIGGILYINGKEIKRKFQDEFYDEKTGETLLRYIEYIDKNKSYNVLQSRVFVSEVNNTKEYRIPKGYYFFLGDNRDNSADSRFEDQGAGLVPYENIVGKAEMIIFSKKQNSLKVRFSRMFKILK